MPSVALTARLLTERGHRVLLHGRNRDKLDRVATDLGAGADRRWVADLARLEEVAAMAARLTDRHPAVDVLINNAGVLKTPEPRTPEGYDIRFVVNAVAPYVLTRRLLPVIPADGRIVNLSSAAQAPVEVDALLGRMRLSDMDAYAQSKLAITIWSQELARELEAGPTVVRLSKRGRAPSRPSLRTARNRRRARRLKPAIQSRRRRDHDAAHRG
ncbi:MAG: SDR family NAD(P)-dependent oxidoreductase [Myxococcota bacterium]